MSTAFDDFVERAWRFEGKVCEDVPGDKGGPTKYGVTLGRLATIKGVREPKRGTAAFATLKNELYALTEDEIKAIYKRDYWDAVRGDDLPAGVNLVVADFGLNSGPSRAVKALQKLCGNPQTGRMDDETIREANAYVPAELIMHYCDERARFLNAIVESNPSQRKFQKGWLSRVGDVRRAALNAADRKPSAVSAPLAMPKAEPAPVADPGTTKELVKAASSSWSIRWIFTAGMAWVENKFGFIRDALPDAKTAYDEIADPLSSFAGVLRQNWDDILVVIAITALVIALYRHSKDKSELNSLKGEPA